MTNTATSKPLRVTEGSKAGPYIWLPMAQLNDVRQLLDRHGIRYTVDENALSLNGGPAMMLINLGREGDARRVQEILDGAD